MEDTTGFVLTIITVLINILWAIISGYIAIYLIRHVRRLYDTNLPLVVNTYIPIFFGCFTNISWSILTILGDIHILISINSIGCQVWGYIYLYIGMWIFNSFSIQAYIRMLNILSPTRTRLRSFKEIIIFIIITLFGTFLLLIPTIFLSVIVYLPNEYYCTIDLSGWKGNMYMILVVYSIPLTITVMTYIRVIKFVKNSSVRSQQHRHAAVVRDVIVLQRILILVGVLVTLGLPSAILWIQGLITGHLHPLTYRIQALFTSISMFTLTIAIALTNPQVKRLLPLFNKHNAVDVMTIQS